MVRERGVGASSKSYTLHPQVSTCKLSEMKQRSYRSLLPTRSHCLWISASNPTPEAEKPKLQPVFFRNRTSNPTHANPENPKRAQRANKQASLHPEALHSPSPLNSESPQHTAEERGSVRKASTSPLFHLIAEGFEELGQRLFRKHMNPSCFQGIYCFGYMDP